MEDDEVSIAAIHHAHEFGVNWIDTAAQHGFGHSFFDASTLELDDDVATAIGGRAVTAAVALAARPSPGQTKRRTGRRPSNSSIT